MNIPWKTRTALWWQRLRNRSYRFDSAMALKNIKQPVTNLLVILPRESEHSRLTKFFIQALQNAMGPEKRLQVRYIAIRKNLEYIDPSIGDRLITYSKEHINRWGLPEKFLLEIIFPTYPDAVVDLNMDFDPVAASIVQKSNAPLRIGFYCEESEPYYNIMIDNKGDALIEEVYKHIHQLLGLT